LGPPTQEAVVFAARHRRSDAAAADAKPLREGRPEIHRTLDVVHGRAAQGSGRSSTFPVEVT
jgi:hypothetical protein